MRPFSLSLSHFFSYTERALTPIQYSSLLHQNIKHLSFQQMMHNLHLYQNNIQVFDYDLYHKVCDRVLDYQKKINISDICTILKLGVKHQIRSQVVWRHLQAELYRRLYDVMNPVFEREKKEEQKLAQSTIKKLEQGSNDHFQILTPQFIQSQTQTNIETKQQTKIDTIPSKPQKSLTYRRTPQILSHIPQLIQPLIWFGCSNTKFLTMLLQTQLHPLYTKQTPLTPTSLIKYAQLLTYISQVNLKQYETNKNKYTARSIKRIYQFHGIYFNQLVKNLQNCIGQFKGEEIKYLMEVIGSFPVKKREYRGKIVGIIGGEMKRRLGEIDEQGRMQLEEILGKDHKLIAKFRKSIGYITAQQTKNQQRSGQEGNKQQEAPMNKKNSTQRNKKSTPQNNTNSAPQK